MLLVACGAKSARTPPPGSPLRQSTSSEIKAPWHHRGRRRPAATSEAHRRQRPVAGCAGPSRASAQPSPAQPFTPSLSAIRVSGNMGGAYQSESEQNMVSAKPLTVVLVGAHCSGKSTLGTKLARRLGFRFEAEIGETMLRANGLQQSLQDDESILKAEIERDRVAASKAAIGGGNRVVETWHPGNYAWAAARETPLANLGGWLERATLQAREEMERSQVLVLALNCSEETRRERRQSSGEVRLPRFGGAANEDEFMAVTLNIGKTALATARAMCGDAAVRELDTSGSVEETVNAAVRELLDMLMPVPEVEAAPLWFRSFSSAFDTLMVGARLLPELREELQRDGGLMRDTFAMAEAASVAGASKDFPALSVVAVEGLDGAGKSTLVRHIAPLISDDASNLFTDSSDCFYDRLTTEID
mmetsp:Transcript_917/g.2304  ORF Transcript_917/g.2304 Transcript_917/m.2304 type:complete len:418 (+) Transcript_917:120-1373(+)